MSEAEMASSFFTGFSFPLQGKSPAKTKIARKQG
jgi:hypothetical protein